MRPELAIPIAGVVIIVAVVLGVIRKLTLHSGAAGKAFGAFYIVVLGTAIIGAGVAGILYYTKAQKAVLEEPK